MCQRVKAYTLNPYTTSHVVDHSGAVLITFDVTAPGHIRAALFNGTNLTLNASYSGEHAEFAFHFGQVPPGEHVPVDIEPADFDITTLIGKKVHGYLDADVWDGTCNQWIGNGTTRNNRADDWFPCGHH